MGVGYVWKWGFGDVARLGIFNVENRQRNFWAVYICLAQDEMSEQSGRKSNVQQSNI